jgi:hypothetical protein
MMVSLRRAKPNMSAKEAQAIKRWVTTAFEKTSMVAMTDHKVILKEVPQIRQPSAAPVLAAPPLETLTGQWQGNNGQYTISFSDAGTATATVEDDRLRINFDGPEMVFLKEI